MNAEALLENFEVLAEASGGISTLKKLIFELAISGRLVDQVPDEGDSQVLVDELVSTRESQLRERLLPIREVAIAGDSQPSFEIPNSWRWTRLGSICYPQAGFAFKSSEFNTIGKGLPLIRIRDISTDHTQCHYSGDYRSEFVVRNGDWLIGMDGNFNIHKWLGSDALLNQRVTRLIFLNENISKRFIAWSLQHQVTLLMGTKSYTTVDHLSTKQINEALIPIPPIAEQVRIVAKVDELMALCDQLEQSQKQRDHIRTAARKSAIDAISTATTPEELETAWKRINKNWDVIADTLESIDAMRKMILDLHTTPRTDQGDAILKLGQVVQVLNGDRSANYPSKEYRVESGIPFINAGHLQNGDIDMSEMDFITPEKFQSLKGGKVQDGDILFCLRGSLGKCAIVKDIKEGTVASSLAILRPNKQVNSRYLLRFLQSGSCGRQIKKFDNGSAQPNLAAKSILNFELYLPAVSAQNQIVKEIDELMALCDQIEAGLKVRSEVAEKFARAVVSAA
jgi:type I restriction enzyme S subunit